MLPSYLRFSFSCSLMVGCLFSSPAVSGVRMDSKLPGIIAAIRLRFDISATCPGVRPANGCSCCPTQWVVEFLELADPRAALPCGLNYLPRATRSNISEILTQTRTVHSYPLLVVDKRSPERRPSLLHNTRSTFFRTKPLGTPFCAGACEGTARKR